MTLQEKERDELLKLRGHLAHKKGGAPYTVFKDSELELLLSTRPKNISELSSIKGFPIDGKRVELYGELIVKVFQGKPIPLEKMNKF